MNASQATGLGEPEPIGKKSLFQPPGNESKRKPSPPINRGKSDQRVRMTLDITKKSLSIIQEVQSRFRLDTGRILPKWKIISESLELYEQSKKGQGNE